MPSENNYISVHKYPGIKQAKTPTKITERYTSKTKKMFTQSYINLNNQYHYCNYYKKKKEGRAKKNGTE
jgi:hypothetical protein